MTQREVFLKEALKGFVRKTHAFLNVAGAFLVLLL
jgi:hypothetical protein